VPSAVFGATNAANISAGTNHTTMMRLTGTVASFGGVDTGQLGNGSPQVNVPIPVIGF
jgi:alpha-tubulin suppressor-like RCC1 family protein